MHWNEVITQTLKIYAFGSRYANCVTFGTRVWQHLTVEPALGIDGIRSQTLSRSAQESSLREIRTSSVGARRLTMVSNRELRDPESKGLAISTAETVDSFVIEDVSDDAARLTWAFDLIVQGYLPLSSQTLDPWEVREDVCDDAYHRHGLARTLVLTGRHPETGEAEPLGTVRVTMGSKATTALGVPPLEAMGLMAPAGGWENFHFQGVEIDHIAEGGRVAVSPTCRIGPSRALGLPGIVLRTLFERGFRFAVEHYGKTQYWGILPSYVIKRVEALGIRVIPAPAMAYRSEEIGHILSKYDRYWLHSNPTFCRVIVPSATIGI